MSDKEAAPVLSKNAVKACRGSDGHLQIVASDLTQRSVETLANSHEALRAERETLRQEVARLKLELADKRLIKSSRLYGDGYAAGKRRENESCRALVDAVREIKRVCWLYNGDEEYRFWPESADGTVKKLLMNSIQALDALDAKAEGGE